MHSKSYNKIKWYYDQGFWTEDQVRRAVANGLITKAEFAEITGKDYE